MSLRLLTAALLTLPGAVATADIIYTERLQVEVTTVAGGLEHPWSIAFLPDGRMLVTERPGRLRYVDRDGKLSAPIAGVPAVRAVGQGGLLDVILDPGFATSKLVYFSYSEPGQGDESGTAVARARLAGEQLEDLKVIFRQQPKIDSPQHYGSRLVFDREGRLYVTLGDRGSQRDSAQDLGTHLGKVLRINSDGSVPEDNPFVGREGALPEIWSYGHRNVQGATLHPWTGELWTHEHGPRGGDEINKPAAGRDYGWPVITFGREYFGPAIGEGTAKDGMEQPLHQWTPSIAPSGMAFYDGELFPMWRGSLIVGALAAMQLARLQFHADGQVQMEERIRLNERIRDVRQGPDGALYVLTDTGKNSRLLRLAPAP